MRNIKTDELKQILFPIKLNLKKPLFLIAFGDIHKESPDHADHDWQRFCEYYAKFRLKNQCLFIGMGDYTEFHSIHENLVLDDPRIHASTLQKLDKEGEIIVDRFYGDVSFMEGDLLGLVEGNHRWEFTDGTNSTMRLCNKLKCQYLGVGLYGKLQILEKEKTRHSIDIFASHSTGNCATLSGSLTKGERFSGGVKANIYVFGHDHQHIVADMPLIELRYAKNKKDLRVCEYPRCVIRSGSFLRTYNNNTSSYAVAKLYKPAGIGSSVVEIYFSESSSGDRYYKLNPQLRSW